MTLQEWKNSGTLYQYKEHQIFCKEAGGGEPLILVHGFPTSSWDWSKVWDSLIQKYTVYTLDMMGYGFSSKPTNFKYTIAAQVDLWEAFLKEKNISEFHILAHDFGDTVVQEMLARLKENPEYGFTIKSVCFLNGGMFPETNFPTLTQRMLLTPFGVILKHFMGRNTLAKNFRKIFGKDTQPTEQEIDDFWETIDYNSGKEVIPKLIKYLKERDTYKIRWREAIQYTNMPKRLIDGGVDPISGKHMAEFYKEIVPDADVIILETIGHYPQTEAPEKVLSHYYEFREKVRS
ncbi:alpha/beta hydrolase [Aquimarina sp. 2201CG5-10]|uniref:alpha/beta fold hydrolase n=1 Tax=Aquimarina callyspongiae TaxID=3098150 RepID=UPI002AB384CB|nr:alpha/beta hydrolase [Aquimarina sp. 2201CG5-10]MDY8137826.1 alpha/beta hydrolase [Aquimarina sp. 2201CG5-10]